MKPSHRNPLLRKFILATSICLSLCQAVHAAPRTWTGSDGIWETGVVGGWDDVWTAADTATFNGSGGIVTLQSDIAAGVPLLFSSGNYTLQSNDTTERIITLGAIGAVAQGASVTTTIGSKATISSSIQWAVDGVNKAGNTFIIENGGKLSNSSGLLTIRETTFNIKTGGILDNNNSIIIGDTTDGAIVNVQGGTLSIPATAGTNLILGNGGVTSTVNVKITAGDISITNASNTGGIRYGGNAAGNTTGVFDLDGGLVTVNKIYEATSGVINSTFNFNGGTLKASKTNTTDFMTGLDAANVKSLGAKIDSAAFNINIAQSLLDGGGGGGLTKSGSGTLGLSGTNTYTGGSTVNEGALSFLTLASLPATGAASAAASATIGLGVLAGNAAYFQSTDLDTLFSTGTLGNITVGATSNVGIDTTAGNFTYASAIGATTRGLVKLGANTLTLTGANSYTGPTTVSGSGVLLVQNASALGTTASGTTVVAGARLELEGNITVTGEAATLAGGSSNFFGALQSKTGVNKWTGNITIAANDTRIGAQVGSSLEVSGIIDSGINNHIVTFRPENGTAAVIVTGNNTYVGPTTLTGGLVNASSLNRVVGGTASSNFGAPTTVANGTITFGAVTGSGLRYTGTGETTDRVINLGGSTQGSTIDQSGSGLLKFTSGVTATVNGAKTLTLQGSTAGAGEIAGPIANSTSATSLAKAGTGTWTLSGTNSYTGTTAVNSGTLKLNYDTGAGGTDTTKLSNTAALTLGGGTLELIGGTHPEVVLSTTLTAGTASKLVKTGGTAVLQMNTITRGAGASIDFSTSGIATTDNLNINGILGAWATINGTDWAANSTNAADGLITAASYTDLDAQPGGSGTTVINNGGSTNVRIFGNGASPGNITLGASTVNINTLLQSNTTQSAVIDPGSTDTLQTGAVMIGTTARALTIGSSMDDGILTAATAGGDLLLRNYSTTELLTVNSTIANNTSASTLTKDGLGAVVLSGTNTYTGATNLVEGTLRAGSSQGFNGTGPLVMTGSSTLDLGGFNGAFTNLTTAATNTITTTGAGSGVDTLTISALTGTSAALFTDNGIRQLALSFSGANSPLSNVGNTFSGGLSIGSTVRLSVIAGTVGTPGAIVNGPFGRGSITVNGGNVFDAGAQIWFAGSNRTLVNNVIVNGNGGMGSRSGTFRIGTNTAALTNIGISGNIDANLASAWFGSDSTSDGTALLLSGKLTGTSGFRFFVSANSSKWTTTLNNATGSPNDYAGNTVVNSAPTTLALGAANQIPNGSGKGNVDVTAGTLDLAGFSETINGLIGTGTVDNVATGVSNTLTIGDGDATGTSFSGVIKNTTGTLALTKIGTGTQTLSGVNTYSGATTINGGTLALGAVGTIDNTSAISVAAGAKLETLLKSSYVMPSGKTITFGIDGAGSGSSGQINAAGLDISGATVAFNVSGPLDDAAYVLASYTSKTGAAFGSVTPPSGYTIDYSYNSGTQIALVQSVGTPYDTWIDGYPSITGLDKLPSADPDKDGLTNQQEFAFGLIPNSGSSVNPITIQLSKTTGEFTYQRLATSGLTYTIWTSPDLATWTEDTTASAGQVVTPGTPNQSVLVTLTGSKPLTATKIFVRVKAN